MVGECTMEGPSKPGFVSSDVVIVESSKVDGVPERRKFGRMKLLQFSENHRPAYWGTWNKKTTVIHPRDPWAQDRVSVWALLRLLRILFSMAFSQGSGAPQSSSFLALPFPPDPGDDSDCCVCALRTSLTTRWTATRSGKRRSRESPSPTAKG